MMKWCIDVIDEVMYWQAADEADGRSEGHLYK